MWKPSGQFTTPVILLKPSYEKVNGVPKKTYTDTDTVMYCCWKSYGGTRTEKNGVEIYQDTAEVETFYNPDVSNDCAFRNLLTGLVYEVMNQPEDVEQRNQYLKFKVRKLRGGSGG